MGLKQCKHGYWLHGIRGLFKKSDMVGSWPASVRGRTLARLTCPMKKNGETMSESNLIYMLNSHRGPFEAHLSHNITVKTFVTSGTGQASLLWRWRFEIDSSYSHTESGRHVGSRRYLQKSPNSRQKPSIMVSLPALCEICPCHWYHAPSKQLATLACFEHHLCRVWSLWILSTLF